jgi:DNA-binding response OmpR family regulator
MSQNAPAILILEDTRTVQNYIRDVLRPLEATHPFLLARKLLDAQKLAESACIALFIVDIGLPDGDGIDFLCEMSVLHPNARALIITSTPTDDYRERARQLGVLHFLAKPLERKSLFDAVQRLLSPSMESGAVPGFEGTLGGISPVDLIQLKCLRGTTGTVEFREEHLFGRIWLDGGEIVHAECKMPGASHEGLEAFRCILTWRTGSIRDIANAPAAARSIHIPWEQLLMDSESATCATAQDTRGI